ncbi:glutathione S-transferase family protein [Kordiimonas aestuarii]|uniref:glutathione S-transferase family protein n=1 Tax=Kordiimonas aestuarii TaxID=1005925 RepID=UPI0021CFED4B|nr:glutathione S-transferase family protein [Kordiimonas aestuarii]
MTKTLKLYAFPTGEGMFNMSPFCCKADILFKIADLEYEHVIPEDFRVFPKAKLPVLDDNGVLVEDSEIIRQHLEHKHGANFNGHLSAKQEAFGHALCRMAEERTRYALLYFRWHDDAGWAQTKGIFFADAPDEVADMVRDQVRETLHLDGFGRHSEAEIKAFLHSDLDALSTVLNEDNWFFGDIPTYIDACIFGLLANFHASPIRTWTHDLVAEFPNLEAYVKRGLERWYPGSLQLLRAA